MLMGNLTRDPEIKYLPKGTAICQIGLAVNRVWSNEAGEKQEETTFVDVEFFGKKAEVIVEYFNKGKPIYVEGRLKLDQWDDKTSGQKKSKLKVVGETFEFIGGKDESSSSRPQGEHSKNPPAARVAQRPPQRPADPDLDAPEDDIPF